MASPIRRRKTVLSIKWANATGKCVSGEIKFHKRAVDPFGRWISSRLNRCRAEHTHSDDQRYQLPAYWELRTFYSMISWLTSREFLRSRSRRAGKQLFIQRTKPVRYVKLYAHFLSMYSGWKFARAFVQLARRRDIHAAQLTVLRGFFSKALGVDLRNS